MKVNAFRTENNNTAEFECCKIAKKFVADIIEELKYTTIAKEFENTNVYIDCPEKIFSAKNFTLDRVKCAIFDAERTFIPGNIRCCDIFMSSKYFESNVILFDYDKLILFVPGNHQDEPPTIVFDCDESDCKYEIYGDFLVVGFDWETNSFKDITQKDLEKLESITY